MSVKFIFPTKAFTQGVIKRDKRKNSDYMQENNADNEGNSSIPQKLY